MFVKEKENNLKNYIEISTFILFIFALLYSNNNDIFHIPQFIFIIISVILIGIIVVFIRKVSDEYTINYIKKTLKALLIFVFFCFSGLLEYIPVKLLNISYVDEYLRVILGCFSELIVLIVLFIIYRKELKKEFYIFKNKLDENLNTGLIYWLLGLAIMFISNAIIIFVFKLGQANNQQAVNQFIKTAPIWMLIEAGVLAPIVEEIIFRKSIKDMTTNKKLFIFFSSLIFGLMHIIPSAKALTDFLFLLPYGILGFSFAKMYSKTDTVFTSISFHMIHNIILTLLSIAIL